jgi:hypothetical protein
VSAEPAPLRLVNPDTGEIHDHGCPHCAQHEADVRNLEGEVTKLLRRIRVLEADKERERRLYAHRELIRHLFEFWRDCTGHPKSKLDGDRFDAIKARVEDGYSEEQCRLAILGAAVDPYVDPKKKRHDGIGLVFRNGEKLEDFANRAYRWGEKHR